MPFLAMKLVEGEDLKAIVKTRGVPEFKWTVNVMAAVARAVHYCHGQGVVHRDLKPANVLIEHGSGRPVLVDFGLAKRDPGQLGLDPDDGESLSRVGEVKGTPAFMAPEQAEGDPESIGPQTDVYGLGATLYYILTGQAPFCGASSINVMVAVLRDPPPDPRKVNPEIPPELAELCLQSMAKNPTQRPGSADVFAERSLQETALVDGAVRRRARRLRLGLAGVILGLIVATAYYLVSSPSVSVDAPEAAIVEPSSSQPEVPDDPHRANRLLEAMTAEPPARCQSLLVDYLRDYPDDPHALKKLNEMRPWVEKTPGPSRGPSPRIGAACAFDETRKELVLIGGCDDNHRRIRLLDDMWCWNGHRWTATVADQLPPARFCHAMVYDAGRKRLVLFGGATKWWHASDRKTDESSRRKYLGDLWEWDEGQWHRRETVGGPGPRGWHGMAYSLERKVVLLFGGIGEAGALNDLWEWDGEAWSERRVSPAPAPRYDFALAYDPSRRVLILHGGQSLSQNQLLGDLWEWDGTVWRERDPGEHRPRARIAHAMVHTRMGGLLFGGAVRAEPKGWKSLDDTWVWDGARWTELHPLTRAIARCRHSLAWDPLRQAVVLFGGWDRDQTDDTWEYSLASSGQFGHAPPSSRSDR